MSEIISAIAVGESSFIGSVMVFWAAIEALSEEFAHDVHRPAAI